MKRKLRRLLIVTILLVPGTGLAFFGIGESTILTGILSELVTQTTYLINQISNLHAIIGIKQDIRQGINDIFSIELADLGDRQITVGDIYRTARNPERTARDIFILGRTAAVDEIDQQVIKLYGELPLSRGNIFGLRDEQAVHSLSHASLIQEEALQFSDIGSELLNDLEWSREGKATIRGAQATAVQVQQLANIEANQGLMISLQAQQVLSTNEVGKSLTETSDAYMDMLGRALQQVAEEEQ